jgi:hypothetical protein
MKKDEKRNLEVALGLKKLGWKDAEIESGIQTIVNNPDKTAIVMPEHYREEAEAHAENTCKYIHGVSPSDKRYEKLYKKAFNEYLVDAYTNSTGIDQDDIFGQNPVKKKSQRKLHCGNNPAPKFENKYSKKLLEFILEATNLNLSPFVCEKRQQTKPNTFLCIEMEHDDYEPSGNYRLLQNLSKKYIGWFKVTPNGKNDIALIYGEKILKIGTEKDEAAELLEIELKKAGLKKVDLKDSKGILRIKKRGNPRWL